MCLMVNKLYLFVILKWFSYFYCWHVYFSIIYCKDINIRNKNVKTRSRFHYTVYCLLFVVSAASIHALLFPRDKWCPLDSLRLRHINLSPQYFYFDYHDTRNISNIRLTIVSSNCVNKDIWYPVVWIYPRYTFLSI